MAASPLPERAWTAWFYPDHGWTLFHLEGRDVRDWLQRQGTQDARRLDIGESLWNAFLNRKGEIECLFLMSPSESGVMAMVPPGFRQSFLDRVERYVILEDVTYRVLCDGPPVVMVVGGESAAALAEALWICPLTLSRVWQGGKPQCSPLTMPRANGCCGGSDGAGSAVSSCAIRILRRSNSCADCCQKQGCDR